MSLQRDFASPPAAYRGKPFWSLNGRLEESEMRRQLEVLQQMGFGGFFIHPRVGLETPYLERDWFKFVDACLARARELGSEAWLYDEDRWASGSAGGKATRAVANRMRALVLRYEGPGGKPHAAGGPGAGARPLGRWHGPAQGGAAEDFAPLAPGAKVRLGSGEAVIALHAEVTPCHSWYNGYTYLDTLSQKAVRAFLDITHEAYRKRYRKDFGGLIPGMFTDEPNFGFFVGSLTEQPSERYAYLPWTPELPRVFRERYGYDVRHHLLELFFDRADGAASPVRYHFYDCLTHLFATNYAGQIGAWCRENDLLFTGHVLFEEPLMAQTAVGGAAMRFYEHMSAPGVDILTQYRPEYDTVKQCASVAHQTGSQWVLSELYGCTGWDFPLEGHKALGDWQAALGINLRCHHLAWYTMAGEAKRDYPASIFFQSPWWEHYRVVEDYFARVGLALTQGEPLRRLLVVHPIESMWLLRKPETWQGPEIHPWPDQVADPQGLAERLKALRTWLLDAHLDFDYGDEEMLGRLASVRRRGGKPVLQVGKAVYERVIVPQRATIRATTLQLLERFIAAGGSVVFEGEPAGLVDALPSAEAARVAAQGTRVRARRGEVIAAAEAGLRDVSLLDASGREIPGVLHMLRRDGARTILFFCNTDRKRGHGSVTVRIRAAGAVTRLNAETGVITAVEARAAQDAYGAAWVEFQTELPASGSRLFMVDAAQAEAQGGSRRKQAAPLPAEPRLRDARRARLRVQPEVALSEPNVAVLDYARARFGRGAWSALREILKIDRAAREKLGLPLRGGEMAQPWTRRRKHAAGSPGEPAGPTLPLALEYVFDVDALPQGELTLVLEMPERFTIALNGQPVAVSDAGWWVDPALRRVVLPAGALRTGENWLELRATFGESLNLEAMYLLGDFSVTLREASEGQGPARPSLGAPVRRLRLGDWTRQGLPFYGAAVAYTLVARPEAEAGERVFLALPKFDGALARVLVQGSEAGFAAWPPYELDLTDWAARGEELTITIELYSSRRNSFGPLHLTDRAPVWVGPEQFISEGELWSDAYQLVPYGLNAAPELIYRSPA